MTAAKHLGLRSQDRPDLARQARPRRPVGDKPVRLLPGVSTLDASWWMTAGRTNLQEEPEVKKEREAKDDGRYIIFYTFEDEEEED